MIFFSSTVIEAEFVIMRALELSSGEKRDKILYEGFIFCEN